MTWNAPITWSTGQTVTSAQLNAQLRDNLNETAVAKATTAGGYFVATGTTALAQRTIGHIFDSSTDTTASTTFTDLTGGASPSVTVTTGNKALVTISCSMSNNTVDGLVVMGVDVSGASTVAANDSASLRSTSSTANANQTASYAILITLTSGSNVFLGKYRVSAGTGSFGSRRIIVYSL